MRAKVSKWGNSLGIRLPKALMEQSGLREGQSVELSSKDGGFDVRPTSTVPRYALEELVAEMEKAGPAARPAYEDWGILPSEWPQEDWSDVAPKDEELGIVRERNRRRVSRQR